MGPRGEAVGLAYAAGAGLLFGTSYVATAFALRSFSPLATTGWRGLLGSVALIGLMQMRLLARPTGPATPATVGRLVVLGALGGPGIIIGTNFAVTLIGPAATSLVAGLYVVLAAVLAAPVLHERLRMSAIIGLAVALLGTALVGELRAGAISTLGVVAALSGALSYGLFLVLSRRWSRQGAVSGPPIALATVGTAAVGGMALLALTSPGAILPARVDPLALVGLVWVAFAAAIGQLLVVASLQRVDARRSSTLLLLNPPTAAVLSWWLLDQPLQPLQVAGAVLILVSIAIASGVIQRGSRWPRGSPLFPPRVGRV